MLTYWRGGRIARGVEFSGKKAEPQDCKALTREVVQAEQAALHCGSVISIKAW